MKSLGVLATHIAGTAHTRCTMLRLDLVDGTTLAITDHDQNISFDLGDGAVTYLARTGILPSDLSLSVGFDGSDIEVDGPIGASVTRAAILGGRYDDAVARLFQVNWADLTQGYIPLLKGRVTLAEVKGGKFKLTVEGDASRFSQTVGRVISAYCDADFGDARCGFPVTPLAATVASVTDDRTFSVTFSGSYADNYFNRGTVTFTSGALNGTRPVEILSWTGAGAVALWTGLPQPPQVGDTLTLKQGCSKLRQGTVTYIATVQSVTDNAHFSAGTAGNYVDRFFNGGSLKFTSGANASAAAIAVSGYVDATGAFTMASAFGSTVSVGDTFQVTIPDSSIPTCKSYGNVLNFRGFPDVPGSDQVLRYPNPGA